MKKVAEFCGNPIAELDDDESYDSYVQKGIYLCKGDMEKFMAIFRAGLEAVGIILYPIDKNKEGNNYVEM